MKGKNEEGQVSGSNESSNQEDLSSGFLNVRTIARYLRLQPSTVYSLVEEKKVPHYRIGRQIRFRRSEVDEWMEGQREAAVDIKIEDRRVVGSLQRRPGADVDRIMKKAIEDTKKKGYTVSQEKSGGIKGLETEVKHGLV
jgi:excisionase family DNA binding protein